MDIYIRHHVVVELNDWFQRIRKIGPDNITTWEDLGVGCPYDNLHSKSKALAYFKLKCSMAIESLKARGL